MMKVIGAGLVMISCTGIGFVIAKNYRDRSHQLRALILSLRALQAEVEYSVTPLPQALRKVANRSRTPLSALFDSAASVLQDGETSVLSAFQDGIAACEPKCALKARDFEVVTEFGRTLGTSDRVHQSQHFDMALAQLDGLEREARDAQHRHERLWQYIGILTGLFLVVLLY